MRALRKIVLGVLGALSVFPLVFSAQRQQIFVSPDSRLRVFILPACGKKGLENTESTVEIHSSGGKLLYREAYSSPDCEHGMRVVRAEWTPDSQFFVFSSQGSGGHQPWHYPTQFYIRRLNIIWDLDSYVDPVLTPNFILSARNTIQTETSAKPGPQGRGTVTVSLEDLTRRAEKYSPEVFHPPNSGWISFSAGPGIVQYGQYKLTQKYDSDTGVGQIYIEREKDGEPRLIFTNRRAAEFLIGHRGGLALINYAAATKDFEVYIANIRTGQSWRIDEQALRMFAHDSGADPSLITVAAGEALSPDDQEALLSMNLIYISVSTSEEAEQRGKTFKKWWYAVSTSTGQVLHEYRTLSMPEAWRTEYGRSENETPPHRLKQPTPVCSRRRTRSF